MKYIVNFSGGLCSFWAAVRMIRAHGRENVVLLFADVLIEDQDLYEFLGHAENILGIPVTRVSREIEPWELFRREGLIGNNRSPICSIRLKREPLNEWMQAHYELDQNQHNAFYEPATVVLGFDATEWHRVADFQAKHPTWLLAAPMTEPPAWDKCRMIQEAEKLGFKQPSLYAEGFPHNNCGGRCVRAGISHWVHLCKIRPASYLDWELKELETMADFRARGIEPLTILKDRRGGETKPLSLQDLRQRIESGEEFPDNEWGGCGCGGVN